MNESEKSINPHTESSPDSVMLSAKHETSNTNASKDVSATPQRDNTKDTDLLTNLYGNNRETNIYANMESNPNIKAQEKALKETDSNFTYTTQETKGIKDLRNDLKEALNPYLNKEIVNKETGIIATISTKGLTKISSSKAVAKTIQNGFTRDEHFKVAQDLKSLFENSKLKESHADTKARDEIQAVHRFTKSLQINGSQAEAKITLFENNQAGNKIYSLELESLEKPTPLSPSTPQTKAGVADLTQSVGGDANPTNIAKTDSDIIPKEIIKEAKQSGKSVGETKELIKDSITMQSNAHLGSDEYNLLKNLVDELYKPQTPQEIIEKAKQSGKSVKETKELLQKNKELEAKSIKEKEKQEKLAQIKQKTITKIDNYAKTKAFKELSKDKQEAILYLKEI